MLYDKLDFMANEFTNLIVCLFFLSKIKGTQRNAITKKVTKEKTKKKDQQKKDVYIIIFKTKTYTQQSHIVLSL